MGKNNQTVNYTDSQSKGEYVYIADTLGSKDGFLHVEMRNRFKKGDELEILSPDGNFKKSFTVETVYDSNGELVEDCKRVQEKYQIACPYEVGAGDFLRRKA